MREIGRSALDLSGRKCRLIIFLQPTQLHSLITCVGHGDKGGGAAGVNKPHGGRASTVTRPPWARAESQPWAGMFSSFK